MDARADQFRAQQVRRSQQTKKIVALSVGERIRLFKRERRTISGYVMNMVPPHATKRESPIGVLNIEARDLSRVGSTRLATVIEADYGITHATKIAGLQRQWREAANKASFPASG